MNDALAGAATGVAEKEEGHLAQQQLTVARPVEIEGIGLHSGASARLRIVPVGANHGITFRRRDLGGLEIPAAHLFLRSSSYATSLARDEMRVSTVEHLLAALYGMEIDNARIEMEGPEVPILDGSARSFVERIRAAGLRALETTRRYLSLEHPIALSHGDKAIAAIPSNEFQITYAIDFPHPAIGYQAITVSLSPARFAEEIASARTFCLLREVEMLRRAGLALGGSLENALVVGDDGVINGALRFPDEFVRHKVLDLVGDLALLRTALRAHVIAFKAGHLLHAALVNRLLSNRASWSLGTSDDRLPYDHVARFAHLTERLVPRKPALAG